MSRRARARADGAARLARKDRFGVFARWVLPSDPDEILPEIIAARCLGITTGDPGPLLPPEVCRPCWGNRHVWLGNTWGMRHGDPAPAPDESSLFGCGHGCHEGETWLAESFLIETSPR